MAPRPTGRDIALGHRPYGSFHPNRGVDVDDPDEDGRDGRRAMNEYGDPLDLNRGGGSEVHLPDDEPGEKKYRHQQRHGPEDELLAGVESPQLRHAFFLVHEHTIDRLQPGDVVTVPEIVTPELQDQPEIAH